MKKLVWMIWFLAFQAMGQEIVTTPEFKSGRAAGNSMEKKMAKAPKKLFINSFSVSYQVLFYDQESTRSGLNYGATSASLTVGFDGLEPTDYQAITDKLYANYASMMESEGYEIISTNGMEGNKGLAKAELIEAGKPEFGTQGGYITTTPTGFKYFLEKDRPVYAHKLGVDAVIADISIEVPFIVDAESGASKLMTDAVGGVSKIVVKPGLHISEKSRITYTYPSQASFIKVPLEKGIWITGVFEDEKFKSSSSAISNVNYGSGLMRSVQSWDVDESRVQTVKGDPEKYKKGVFEGSELLLSESAKVFLSWTEK